MKEIEKGYYIAVSKRPDKKYSIFTKDHKGYKFLLHFGARDYEQFKDSTPLKAFSYKDHGDKDRRRLYFARHGLTSDKTSPKYWSNKYLW